MTTVQKPPSRTAIEKAAKVGAAAGDEMSMAMLEAIALLRQLNRGTGPSRVAKAMRASRPVDRPDGADPYLGFGRVERVTDDRGNTLRLVWGAPERGSLEEAKFHIEQYRRNGMITGGHGSGATPRTENFPCTAHHRGHYLAMAMGDRSSTERPLYAKALGVSEDDWEIQVRHARINATIQASAALESRAVRDLRRMAIPYIRPRKPKSRRERGILTQGQQRRSLMSDRVARMNAEERRLQRAAKRAETAWLVREGIIPPPPPKPVDPEVAKIRAAKKALKALEALKAGGMTIDREAFRSLRKIAKITTTN